MRLNGNTVKKANAMVQPYHDSQNGGLSTSVFSISVRCTSLGVIREGKKQWLLYKKLAIE